MIVVGISLVTRCECVMQKLIDLKSHEVALVLNVLLKDRTTDQNIIFATEAYTGFAFETMLVKELLVGRNALDIRPRVQKSLEEQAQRTRKKAEVFTPSWICNRMNNHCDAEWFGRENVFNHEQGTFWEVTTEKITFPEGKTWKDYVDSTRLEITCGEAPYLVSRYDTVTGELIPIKERIGMLDRKLRVINENVTTRKTWNQWVYRAFESVYGYEYQGDNLLIARLNLLETFCEYTRDRWDEEPTDAMLKRVANIISWNLWQMDGLHGVVPAKGLKVEPEWDIDVEPQELFAGWGVVEEPTTKEEPVIETVDCKIYDWREDQVITYKSLRGEK